ncbi:MAG: DUF2238 domain-containing protein [Pseudomonadota bacterium]
MIAAKRTLSSGTLLAALCATVWLVSAWQPSERDTWLLEQIASVAGVLTLLWVSRRVQLTLSAQLGIALFFCIHTIGTHYTYSLTPYDTLAQELFGSSINELFGWERNHYDRFVHFAYGLCVATPAQQMLKALHGLPWRSCALYSFHLIVSTSAIYELLEWAAAVVLSDGSTLFLGTQGDVWDAQVDMALAALGAALVLTASWMLRGRSNSGRN